MSGTKNPLFWGKCKAMSSLHDVLTAGRLNPGAWSGLQYQKYRDASKPRVTKTNEIVLLSGMKLFTPPEAPGVESTVES